MITGPMLSFFCNDTSTTEIYTLSLHVALPIWRGLPGVQVHRLVGDRRRGDGSPGCAEERRLRPKGVLRLRLRHRPGADRKSTRLNFSHVRISYAVFCLKKKKNTQIVRRAATKI